MTPRRFRRTAPFEASQGFTLVEILVATALLGLLALAVMGSLRTGLRSWETAIRSEDGSDELRTAEKLLRRTVETAYPLLSTSDPTHPRIDFEGRPDGMVVLAAAPPGLVPGGLVRFTFALESREARTDLAVAARPELARDDATFANAHETVIRNLAAIRFRYFGASPSGGPAEWRDDWIGRMELPRLIRITVTFDATDRRRWPELTLEPRIAVDVACVLDALTKRCRGR
jgi:general secretion pathway protein J